MYQKILFLAILFLGITFSSSVFASATISSYVSGNTWYGGSDLCPPTFGSWEFFKNGVSVDYEEAVYCQEMQPTDNPLLFNVSSNVFNLSDDDVLTLSFWSETGRAGNFLGSVEAIWDSASSTLLSVPVVSNDITSIISVVPTHNSTVATSTSFNFSISGWISESDWKSGTRVVMNYTNGGQESAQVVSPFFGLFLQQPNSTNTFYFYPLVPGYFYYSTTTNLQIIGDYVLNSKIQSPGFLNIWYNDLVNQQTTFIVSSSTPWGKIVVNTINTDWNDCLPITQFSMTGCIQTLLMPNGTELAKTAENARSGFLSYFPLGYITDFITILSTTSAEELPILSADVPPGIPGSGSHIEFTISSSSLDWIWNATSSSFGGTSETLYDYTSYYWNIIVYITLLSYILGRILGSHIIPGINYKYYKK